MKSSFYNPLKKSLQNSRYTESSILRNNDPSINLGIESIALSRTGEKSSKILPSNKSIEDYKVLL